MKCPSAPSIARYLKEVSPSLIGHHLSEPLLISPRFLSYRISGKAGYLAISLDSNLPLIFVSQDGLRLASLTEPFFETLKRELPNPYVEGIEASENDRLVSFKLLTTDRLYKERERTLVLELIPGKPNLILLDEEGRIILTSAPTSLDAKRPLAKGLRYEAPETPPYKKDIPENQSPFDYAPEAIHIALESRRAKRFGPLISEAKAEARRAKRKIEAVKKDIKEAEKHLSDGEMGDAIYMNMDELRTSNPLSFYYDGKEISLDPRYTLSGNADRYYKRAKKAKETIALASKNLERAERELEEASGLLAHLLSADEPALEEYAEKEGYFRRNAKKARSIPFGGASLPYVANYQGASIAFGKNAKQNEVLTFQLCTSPKHLWFHAVGLSGPHLVLRDEAPSGQTIQIAAELALYAAGLEEGEVYMALRKDVRKGKARGEAVLLKSETLRIKSVSDEAKSLYMNAKKWRS